MRAGLILVFIYSAFFTAGCSQGVGDRCVQDSDCASGICSSTGQSAQGGKCLANVTGTGTGGSGAETGQGGASGEAGGGQGGAGGAVDAASPPDATVATDATPG